MYYLSATCSINGGDYLKKCDTGRRHMPKSRCPYCDSRVVDSRTPTLKNSLELTVTDSADYFIQCPKCRKIVGLIIKTMQPTAQMVANT